MLTTVSTLHPTVPTQLVKVKLIKYSNSQPALRSEGPLTETDAVVACCSRGTQQATTAGESQPVMVKAIGAYSTTEVFTWRVPLWSYDELGILWVWRVELWWDDGLQIFFWRPFFCDLFPEGNKLWNASYCRTLQVDKSNTLNYLTILRYFIHWR